MTTRRRTAPATEVPATEPAPAEATQTPGAAEPDTAAPGSEQEGAPEGERPEPALDEAGNGQGMPEAATAGLAALDGLTAEATRLLSAPWPSIDLPAILTADSLAGWSLLAREGGRTEDEDWTAAQCIAEGHRDDGAIRARVFLPRKPFARRPVLTGG